MGQGRAGAAMWLAGVVRLRNNVFTQFHVISDIALSLAYLPRITSSYSRLPSDRKEKVKRYNTFGITKTYLITTRQLFQLKPYHVG